MLTKSSRIHQFYSSGSKPLPYKMSGGVNLVLAIVLYLVDFIEFLLFSKFYFEVRYFLRKVI